MQPIAAASLEASATAQSVLLSCKAAPEASTATPAASCANTAAVAAGIRDDTITGIRDDDNTAASCANTAAAGIRDDTNTGIRDDTDTGSVGIVVPGGEVSAVQQAAAAPSAAYILQLPLQSKLVDAGSSVHGASMLDGIPRRESSPRDGAQKEAGGEGTARTLQRDAEWQAGSGSVSVETSV